MTTSDVPRSRRPRRSRLGLVVFLVALAFGTYKVVDWTLSSGGGGRMAYRPLPYVMYGLTPDYEFVRTPGKDFARTTNSRGFRGPEIEVPKPAGTWRIVCLGGSTTFSDAVGDEHAYPLLMEQVLRERRPDLSIEVVNAGVPSYTTAESLCNLAFRCLELEPDVIVVYHAANDYRPRIYSNFEPSYFHYRQTWNGTLDQQVQGPRGTDMASGINTLVQKMWPDDNGDMVANARAAGTGAFRRNLVSIVGIARAHGVATVLVSFAANPPDPPFLPGLIDGIAEHNRVIREVADAHGVTFIDLDAKLPRTGTFAPDDPVHLTAEGTRIKAEIIAAGLLSLLP